MGYEVVCLYSPYEYNLQTNEGVLVLPQSAKRDANAIAVAFTNAGVGLENIEIKTSLTAEDVRLYLGYGALQRKSCGRKHQPCQLQLLQRGGADGGVYRKSR